VEVEVDVVLVEVLDVVVVVVDVVLDVVLDVVVVVVVPDCCCAFDEGCVVVDGGTYFSTIAPMACENISGCAK
jgi:hypothetical protein